MKSGNSNISDEEATNLLESIGNISSNESRVSKYSALKILGVSRATFDNYIRKGKIPKGNKSVGFKELSWKKKDLIDAKIKIHKDSL